jgi:membrane associated rhomboid family serine protease
MEFKDLKYKYDYASVVMKIIYITGAVFIITFLLNTLAFLFQGGDNFVISWFALSPDVNELLYKPWTLITYGFLHSGILHILFNLLVLYYVGNIFLNFFSKEQFLTYYFSGIITGGVIFMLSYNYLPALSTGNSVLVGASAGVTAILVGLAAYIPNYALHFQFIGRVPLKYLAIFFVALDVIQIPGGNAGGHLAHLGGALIGFLLTNNMNKGEDLIKMFRNLFKPKKQKPLKTVYKKKTAYSAKRQTTEHQRRIDAILDKISKSGYDALSKEEKDFLFKAGKN